MIDRISINKQVPISPDIFQSGWRRIKQLYFLSNYHGLQLFYSPLTQRLIIKGRLILLSAQRDRVTNLDVPWRGIADVKVIQHHSPDGQVHYELRPVIQDLESLILEINADLSAFFQVAIEIREFQVTYCEFCFNVYTDHVGEYLTLFNQIFSLRNPAKYKSYVIENDLQPSSSFYVKSTGQFESRKKDRTVVNFYDKANWLEKQINDELIKTQNELINRNPNMTRRQIRAKDVVPLDSVFGDDSKIRNCLRLEVQLGSKALHDLIQGERPFSSFLDIDIYREIVIKQYEKFIGNETADFYSYPRAKVIIESSPLLTKTRRKNLLVFLDMLNGGHNPYSNHGHHFISIMSDLGIHWYLLQDRDYLIFPMKLLREVVESSKALADTRELREDAAMEEALIYNSMEIEEETTFMIRPSDAAN